VPRLLFGREASNLMVVGESVVTGVPLSALVEPGNYRPVALQATSWLVDLARRSRHTAVSPARERLVGPALAAFAESFGPVLDRHMLHDTEAILATIGDPPATCEQRDFSPWNVLLTPEGDVAVLDWESADLHGLPALDLVYFLAYLGFYRDHTLGTPRAIDSYRNGLDRRTDAGAVNYECFSRYADATGLTPGPLGALRLLTWVLHSRSEYLHFTADAAGRPTPAALEQSLFLRLWREELRQTSRGV
jgi:hypothetical protein